MQDMERARRIRELRERRGQSQEDVADALGVTQKTYWRWENGHEIRGPNLKRLAHYHKVPLDFLRATDSAPDLLGELGERLSDDEVSRIAAELGVRFLPALRKLVREELRASRQGQAPRSPRRGAKGS